MKNEILRVYGVCKGGGGVIVSLLARDETTYHSHTLLLYDSLLQSGTPINNSLNILYMICTNIILVLAFVVPA